ncbi:MAG: DUF1302 family protein [Pseudomonadota bacterium]|nr:DUF1302 family protein [Pseudomonadota bacterium]
MSWYRVVLAAAGLLLVLPTADAAYRFSTPGGKSLLLTGYLRQHMAVNLEDHPEADASGMGRLDGKGDISMMRSTFRLEAKADLGWAQFVTIYRFDREQETGFLDDINDTINANNAPLRLNNWMDDVEGDQMREWYGVFDIGPRVRATLGKQQVVWGETDFFRGMDIIHGFDLRWRSFLETENEELRKPLILANVEIDIPELDGILQLVYRPGWDKGKALGNGLDIRGGRWATQPNKGIDFLPLLPYNYDHPGADTDDPNYGFRWIGHAWGWDYSLNYWRGLNNDPIGNPQAFLGTPFGAAPSNPFVLGELIFPKVETFGATVTGYLEGVDSVLRVELAFTPNKPYNAGPDVGLAGPVPGSTIWVPGLGGVVERDTLISMVGIDKQLKGLGRLLNTSQFPLFSVQVFDTWLMDFDGDDHIVETFGFGAERHEHTTILTGLLQLNYDNSTVNPSIAGVVDATNGDVVIIPALDLVYGDHWRIHTDLDLFLIKNQRNVKNFGGFYLPEDTFATRAEDDTHLIGTFANNSQFNLRVTYQF